MTVPWTGVSLRDLLRLQGHSFGKIFADGDVFRPISGTRTKTGLVSWPYVEGLTLAEATNELAFRQLASTKATKMARRCVLLCREIWF